jgi:acid phosphatase
MALAGCHSAPGLQEPLNISQAKAAVSHYQDSGAYARDLQKSADLARLWIEERCARRAAGEKLAVVFDIDETLLSNAPLIRRLDYAYLAPEWAAWVDSADAPAIEPVRALYRRCLELGLDVFLITGRRDPSDRPATVENLRRQGLDRYVELILAQPGERALTTTQRKTGARAAIEARGYVIIANIGDQESDLRGGHSERTFKLQNPFYLME